ncbi:MAG: permease-like cell division protein FtsX [Gammaproteobacteria bacterium]|nr:permease-like cell division protein FtsX [Gammaproteobacteria bacterium]
MARVGSFPWQDDGREGRGSLARIRLRSVKESLEHLCRHPFVTFFVWLLMGIALSQPAGLWLVQHNIHVVMKEISQDTGLTVWFMRGTGSADIDTTAQSITASGSVKAVTVITAEQALDEFRAASGFNEELAALDSNPLPALLVIELESATSHEALAKLVEGLEQSPHIESVDADTDWMTQLGRMQRISIRLVWILGALFGTGIIFVSVAAVRFAMDSRFEELRVNLLLGASNRFLRRPFNYCGLFYGFGGGVVGAAIVVLALHAIKKPLQELAGSYGGNIEFLAMDYVFCTLLIVVGSALGLLGALQVTHVQMRKDRYLSRMG